MKKLLIIAAITFAGTAFAGGELKEVCKDKVDAKGQVVKDKKGEVVKVCKTIKVHKKLEGKEVPVKK
jgi:hypothetical protein